MPVRGIDHVQLAMPAGGDAQARAFYTGVLGLPERAKPPHLAKPGGCWFECGALQLHLGVEPAFQPARKAHPGLLVDDLPGLLAALRTAGCDVTFDEPIDGFERAFTADPFGNRLELLEPRRTGP